MDAQPLEFEKMSHDRDNQEVQMKLKHDLISAVRFLENLNTEIRCARELSEIQDEAILRRFDDVILFVSQQLNQRQGCSCQN